MLFSTYLFDQIIRVLIYFSKTLYNMHIFVLLQNVTEDNLNTAQ